jgi:hypothetical protein
MGVDERIERLDEALRAAFSRIETLERLVVHPLTHPEAGLPSLDERVREARARHRYAPERATATRP